jgi:hypothetical protein
VHCVTAEGRWPCPRPWARLWAPPRISPLPSAYRDLTPRIAPT